MAKFIIGSLGMFTAASLAYAIIPDDKDERKVTPFGL